MVGDVTGPRSELSNSKFIPSLDGIRAVSIVLVFLGHAGVSRFLPAGFGVTVFFFLSGYLITTLLIEEREKFGNIAIKEFYLRRLIRLSPPLLITICASIGLVLIGLARGGLDLKIILSQIFFVYNYYSLLNPASSVEGSGVLWSLSVEEHFYFLWPFLFIYIANRKYRSIETISLIVLTLAWRFVRFYVFGDFLHTGDLEWMIFTTTDTRIDGLLFGCLLALLSNRGITDRFLTRERMYLILFCCICALFSSFIIQNSSFRSTWRYSIQGIALFPFFFYAVRYPNFALFTPLNWRFMRRLGQYSYTFYLIHYVIIMALRFNGVFAHNNFLFATFAFGLSYAFSAFVYRFVEKPLKPLRAKLIGHSRSDLHAMP